MKNIAENYLCQKDNTLPWTQNEAARSLLEFVYYGGIWDEDFKEKRAELFKKEISSLTEKEIFSYLTAIIAGDRVNEGFYDEKIKDGTIHDLMKRYLEVAE